MDCPALRCHRRHDARVPPLRGDPRQGAAARGRAPTASRPTAASRPPGAASCSPAWASSSWSAPAVVYLRRPAPPARPAAPRPRRPCARRPPPARARPPSRTRAAARPLRSPPPPVALGAALRAATPPPRPTRRPPTGSPDACRPRAPLSPDDVRAAEDLFARYPAAARDLLEAVLLSAAAAETEARRFDAAAALAERAASVAPHSPHARRALLDVRLETGDWAAAEQAARGAPGPAARRRRRRPRPGLRARCARTARARRSSCSPPSSSQHDDPETRALPEPGPARPGRGARPRRGASSPTSTCATTATRTRTSGARSCACSSGTTRRSCAPSTTSPPQPIPVILLSSESYYDATGAPGVVGRAVRLLRRPHPHPDRRADARRCRPSSTATLVHELTHAFVADLSRGARPARAPRGPRAVHGGPAHRAQLGAERPARPGGRPAAAA